LPFSGTQLPSQFLIYGANGYTGSLSARLAVELGLHPILAGRNQPAVKQLSEQLDLEHRIFELDQTEALEQALADVDVVLHCAGPFRHTYRPMAEACLRTATHYLDITGEIGVFQSLFQLDAAAKDRGLMLLPGAGFDVVPTDCLAAHLKRRLPTATHLALAFRSFGPAGISRGTARTTVQAAGGPSWIRLNGELTPVPHFSKTRTIDFGQGPTAVSRMMWGDIYTAYHSTGIPNIEDYYYLASGVRNALRVARLVQPALTWRPVQAVLNAAVDRLPAGPDDVRRSRSRTVVWGEVVDQLGGRATARLHGPESYTFTALTSIAIIQRVLRGEAPAGYQTPASAYGPDFVMEIDGVERQDLD